ncbi:Uncharacterised protein [Sphingobacterium spiritivorum]|uniref:Uncharacterized protein n=1 Tax=Sphingobacterium spiritivorum TaxID=258 RepID=A0A380BLV1_SPHSI|nr:hypothetical protein [Sphingobacterium spiritivorum]SUJ02518.1 Uncharacterised protein [Sphingobacterium spiritivorum]
MVNLEIIEQSLEVDSLGYVPYLGGVKWSQGGHFYFCKTIKDSMSVNRINEFIKIKKG